MAQRRFHYEQAFEHYLRANRVPYVAVDEAKKALTPASHGAGAAGSLKSFDFVVYAPDRNLLIDVKGRMYGSRRAAARGNLEKPPPGGRRFESWVTLEDVECMERWEQLFGEGFAAVFVFAYCLRQQPPDALFEELFEFDDRWYALREVALKDYRASMTKRSDKWGTVSVPSDVFTSISRPFTVRQSATARGTLGPIAPGEKRDGDGADRARAGPISCRRSAANLC